MVADRVQQRQVAKDLGVGRSTVARELASDRTPKFKRAGSADGHPPSEPAVRQLHDHRFPYLGGHRAAELRGMVGSARTPFLSEDQVTRRGATDPSQLLGSSDIRRGNERTRQSRPRQSPRLRGGAILQSQTDHGADPEHSSPDKRTITRPESIYVSSDVPDAASPSLQACFASASSRGPGGVGMELQGHLESSWFSDGPRGRSNRWYNLREVSDAPTHVQV